MDPIDAFKALSMQGVSSSDAIQFQLKQKLRQAKMETSDPSTEEASDLSDLSAEAARLSRPQFEAFLEVAKGDIQNLDRNSKTFLDDATQMLVNSALERKFGEKFANDPGYPQMEAKVRKIILNDPGSRGMIEDFIALLDMEAQQQTG